MQKAVVSELLLREDAGLGLHGRDGLHRLPNVGEVGDGPGHGALVGALVRAEKRGGEVRLRARNRCGR